jgi:hypothetical protein
MSRPALCVSEGERKNGKNPMKKRKISLSTQHNGSFFFLVKKFIVDESPRACGTTPHARTRRLLAVAQTSRTQKRKIVFFDIFFLFFLFALLLSRRTVTTRRCALH